MKVSRKMQQQVELKIRHAMATGPLPLIDRDSTGIQNRRESSKPADSTGHAK